MFNKRGLCQWEIDLEFLRVDSKVRWDFALGIDILSLFANCRYIRRRY